MRFLKAALVAFVLVSVLVGCGRGDSDVIDLTELTTVDDGVEPGFVVLELRPTATVSPTFTAVPPTAVPTPVPTPTPFAFSETEPGRLRPPPAAVTVSVAVADVGPGVGDEVVEIVEVTEVPPDDEVSDVEAGVVSDVEAEVVPVVGDETEADAGSDSAADTVWTVGL